MTRIETRNDTSAAAANLGEISFDFDELFFSRTNKAGIIKFGNSVFQRVSIYSWEELLEKPHKIVRHPDTPRAVFKLLWDTIGRGEPIGAYVKNRSKGGRYYWVYALVTPVEDGYLSVRLRPSSKYFAAIKDAYPALSDRERHEKLAPDASTPILLDTLKTLGFNDYSSFMAAALGAELASRDKHLNRPPDHAIAKFDELLNTAQSLLDCAEEISTAYEMSETVPMNFRILAGQLGEDGAAIGVISNSYSVLSQEMRTILDKFITTARDVMTAINSGYFLVCTARVQREVQEFFSNEDADADETSRDMEVELLNHQQSEYLSKANKGLEDILKKFGGFKHACNDMNQLATGLEMMRVICKVECARHERMKDRVNELLTNLERFQTTLTEALKNLSQINAQIEREAQILLAQAAEEAA